MGAFFSSLWSRLAGTKEWKIVLVGLDSAGKSTILFKLTHQESHLTIPTMGFNVDTVNYKNVRFTIWDLGGQCKLRSLWKHYYSGIDAVIFVVDSTDRIRIIEASYEFKNMLKDVELKDAAILVCANKQDLPGALKGHELSRLLELFAIRDRYWHVAETSGVNGQGLNEALDWLRKHISKRKRPLSAVL